MQAVWENSRGKGEQMKEDRLLHIYLQDHCAGATAGVELAKRCLSKNSDGALGDFLANRLLPEIKEDKASLERVMDVVGAPRARWKEGAVWLAEKTGRLKLNGHIISYSPLSRLLEVEGLCVGVDAKMCMWMALETLSDSRPELRAVDLDALLERARRQRRELETRRLEAAAQALSP
jgi:hypothetical protein